MSTNITVSEVIKKSNLSSIARTITFISEQMPWIWECVKERIIMLQKITKSLLPHLLRLFL